MIKQILTVAILATAAFAMAACASMHSKPSNDMKPAGGDGAKAPQQNTTR